MFGLFDFAADMGKKLFGGDDDPAAEIKKHVLEDNPGIDNLGVAFDSGVVSLSGAAKSTEALEKAVLIAGNVKDVTSVNADNLTAPKPEVEVKVEYYVIKSGDSLSKIAKEYYSNAMEYPRIFEANREVIKNADLIYPGQKIRIPMD